MAARRYVVLLIAAAWFGCVASSWAADSAATTAAAQLSDRAFALLDKVNAKSETTGPMIGPAAALASDAQSLQQALQSGDRGRAGSAMGSLLADRDALSAQVSAHPGAISASEWSSLKDQIDALSKMVTPSPAAAVKVSPETRPEAAAVGDDRNSVARPLRVKLESTAVEAQDNVHLKGFVEGTGLKSAGIYEGSTELKAFDVGLVPGAQRLNFDLQLERLVPGLVIRAADAAGNRAEAEVTASAGTRSGPSLGESPPSLTDAAPEKPEAGFAPGEAAPNGGVSVAPEATTKEIPSLVPPSPAHKHVSGHARSTLGDIRLVVGRVQLVDPENHEYEVVGQVSGSGIKGAGIYVDGKLAEEIEIDLETGLRGNTTGSTFDETFNMNGRLATIRVYGPRDDYVERTIPLNGNPMQGLPMPMVPMIPMTGMSANPNQLGVQITSVIPTAGSIYVVAGQISGRNIAFAGLYQNGALVQQIPITGTSLFALLSGWRQVNFAARFSPLRGPAAVRVQDTTGQIIEQPVMVAGGAAYGTYPAAPYAAPVSPYGNYPAAPYAAPVSPYTGYRRSPSGSGWPH